MSKFPQHLSTLIAYLKKWPGVGAKTAERYAFHLLGWEEAELEKLAALIGDIKKKITSCLECHTLMEDGGCRYCDPSTRDQRALCVIASPKDVFALEETRVFKGLYHVIGTLLSPLQSRNPEHLGVDKLKQRLQKRGVQEIIIALDSTLEGDATALYLKKQLETLPHIKVSRLAFGLPLNSTLDFIDGGTLIKALTGRQMV